MNIYRAYKYRIYPNQAQQEKLAQQFGCARYVFNAYLRARIDNYEHTGEGLSYSETAKHLTRLKQSQIWLKTTAHSQMLQQALMDLDKAFKSFFAGRTKFPRFKRKFDKQSCRFPQGFKLETGHQMRYGLQMAIALHLNLAPPGDAQSISLIVMAQVYVALQIMWKRQLLGRNGDHKT